jgi:hypothetical protein
MLLALSDGGRPPGTWQYNVEELNPASRATSEAVMVPDASIALAVLTFVR